MPDEILKTRLQDDMKQAMRSKDKERLGVIRLALAAIKQREVDERISLDDTQVLVVLDKMIKQRRESISQFTHGGRQDLADKEQFEINLLQEYLPQQLTEAEIRALVAAAIAASGATTAQDMGKVMAILKPQAQGRTDMSLVSKWVKETLGQ